MEPFLESWNLLQSQKLIPHKSPDSSSNFPFKDTHIAYIPNGKAKKNTQKHEKNYKFPDLALRLCSKRNVRLHVTLRKVAYVLTKIQGNISTKFEPNRISPVGFYKEQTDRQTDLNFII
ncbi:hypothetical protein ACFFRR_004221 [Megaselia abdita]